MTANRPSYWPPSDLDIAAELRRQLDEAVAKNVKLQREVEQADQRNAQLAGVNDELQRQVEDMRRVLLGTAEDIANDGREEERGPAFWFASWTNGNRRNAELMLQQAKQAKWLLEHGQEAARLQTALDLARNEIGELTRALDLARAGERCDEEGG